MKNNYRIGENVIFLDFTNNGNITIKQGSDLTLNKIYKTVDTDPLFVWIINDIGLKIGYNTLYHRFESIKEFRKQKLEKLKCI
jgi:hypothetical protein